MDGLLSPYLEIFKQKVINLHLYRLYPSILIDMPLCPIQSHAHMYYSRAYPYILLKATPICPIKSHTHLQYIIQVNSYVYTLLKGHPSILIQDMPICSA